MITENAATNVAQPVANANRLESKKLIQRTRSAVRLPSGTYDFNGVQFGEWNIGDDTIEFMQFNTTSKGKRALSLAALYDTILTSANAILGEIAPLINPDSRLSGQLIVKKNAQDELESVHLNNVTLAELYQA